MRTMLALSVLLLAALTAAEEEKPLLIVAQNIPYARIVVADVPDHLGISYQTWRLDRTRSVRYAAEVLQEYIARSTGVTVPIINANAASRGRPLICVGRSSLTDFAEEDRRKLGPEGYLIRREGRVVAIVGEVADEDDMPEYRQADRGTLFGVYDFLERTLGVRWFFPHELGVVVPPRRSMTVGDLDVSATPAFPMRTGAVYDDAEQGEAGSSLPVVRHGNSTGFHANHTCYGWWKYVKDHPEMFAVAEDGQPLVDPTGPGGNKFNHLCYSEPKTLEMELGLIRDFITNDVPYTDYSLLPSSRYIRCVPKDIENIYHCHCDRCRAQWRSDPPDSGLSEVIFGYMDRLAAAIKAEWPDRRLATLGYCGFLRPPLTVPVPDNMDVMLCTVKGNMKLVAPGHWQETTAVLDEWYEALDRDPSRLYVFEYLVYPSSDAPMLYPHKLQDWVRYMRGKTSGGFSNGTRARIGPARHRFAQVNGWFWHKLLWNPDADVDALLADWYRNLFGPAEKPMAELFTLTVDSWEDAKWGTSVNPGSVSHVHDRTMYTHVYPPATIDRMAELLKQARVAVQGDDLALRRVNYFGEAYEEFFTAARSFQAAVGAPPALGIPILAAAPTVDGKLDDPAWEGAATVALRERRLGGEPEVAVPVRLACRDRVLYVAATCPALPDAPATEPRDHDDEDLIRDDCVVVDLAFRDPRVLLLPMFYRVVVSAAGSVAEGTQIVPLVYEGLHHTRWSPLWAPAVEAAVLPVEGGWQVELAIPLASIPEFAARPDVPFHLQVRRKAPKPRLDLAWSPEMVESYEIDLNRFADVTLGADEN